MQPAGHHGGQRRPAQQRRAHRTAGALLGVLAIGVLGVGLAVGDGIGRDRRCRRGGGGVGGGGVAAERGEEAGGASGDTWVGVGVGVGAGAS